MKNIKVYKEGSEIKTNSKNVAEVFGKSHRHVKRDIEELDCSDEFRMSNFGQSYYISKQNKKLSCIEMTFNGFVFLCMGYRGLKAAQFKESYIQEFERMRADQNAISNLVDEVSREGIELKEAGKKWSELGHQIRSSKKVHKQKVESVINEIQIKLDI